MKKTRRVGLPRSKIKVEVVRPIAETMFRARAVRRGIFLRPSWERDQSRDNSAKNKFPEQHSSVPLVCNSRQLGSMNDRMQRRRKVRFRYLPTVLPDV